MPRSPPPEFFLNPPPHHATSASSSAVIVAIVISSAIIASAALYLLLRLISRRCRRSPRTFSVVDDVITTTTTTNPSSATSANHLIASLPAFTFGSVTGGTLTGGDCAVCLSKFERSDLLRLLPLCCHAFHAQCVDTWLLANLTCPLCRSTVQPTEEEVLNKILSQTEGPNSNSFRIEIGSVSRRRRVSEENSGGRRSYSVGEFDYIVEDSYEVPVESVNHHRGLSDDKFAPSAPEIPAEELAAAVGSGRSWLRDYVDRLASVSSRSSGRFFTGSSRRSEPAVVVGEDAEGYRVGEEISELFRWLSGV